MELEKPRWEPPAEERERAAVQMRGSAAAASGLVRVGAAAERRGRRENQQGAAVGQERIDRKRKAEQGSQQVRMKTEQGSPDEVQDVAEAVAEEAQVV